MCVRCLDTTTHAYKIHSSTCLVLYTIASLLIQKRNQPKMMHTKVFNERYKQKSVISCNIYDINHARNQNTYFTILFQVFFYKMQSYFCWT